MSQTKSVV